MAVFARIIENANYWSRVEDPHWWEDTRFTYRVLKDVMPNPESVSLWLLNGQDDPLLTRIVAAFRAQKDQIKIQDATVRFIDEMDLKKLVNPEKTKHQGLDSGIEKAHYEIKSMSGIQAVKLVELLSRVKPKSFKKSEVARFLAESIAAGHISY